MARKRLVILGSGFGGFRLLKDVSTRDFDVVLISPRNHFLFSPLLTSTTVGTIEFRSIVEPVRTGRKNVQFWQASCTHIDFDAKTLTCRYAGSGSPGVDRVQNEDEFQTTYDVLVVAVGARVNTFGIPGVEDHCIFMKELTDARRVRQRLVDCLEAASLPDCTPEEKDRLLHFVVIGGGPTGVEFAAELHDFVREDLRVWYPTLYKDITITLLEASQQILGSFRKKLGNYTMRLFKRRNIHVRLSSPVTEVGPKVLTLQGGEKVPYGLAVWSGGIGPVPLVKGSDFPLDDRGRILTDEYLQVVGKDGVFAVGDCAQVAGAALPATAQLAQQQGKYLAKYLPRVVAEKSVKPFRFKNLGMLAYVGKGKALASLPVFDMSGFIAWVMWKLVYITKLVSWRNKILVVLDWVKARLFGRDVSRF